MRDEFATPTDGDPAFQDPLAQARIDFREAFDLGLFPATLANDASTFPDTLFNHTVKRAIAGGFIWKKGNTATDFALREVEHIAALAKIEADADEVKAKFLRTHEKRVIRYWKKKCKIKSMDGFIAVFCVLYDDDGNYTGP